MSPGEGSDRDGGDGPPSGDYRMVLNPALAALLGLVVAVFLGGTAYVSHLPLMHHNIAFDALEGLVVGTVVAVIAATRGLTLRERRERPSPGGGARRRRRGR